MKIAELSLNTANAERAGFITDPERVEDLLDQIAEIDGSIFSGNQWGRESFRDSALQDYDQLSAVLGAEDRVLAFGLLRMFDDAEVIRIAVRPEERRNGYGRAVLDGMLSEVRNRNIENVFLEVRSGNKAARELYTHAGFTTEGIRKAYYSNPSEDAVIMRYTC